MRTMRRLALINNLILVALFTLFLALAGLPLMGLLFVDCFLVAAILLHLRRKESGGP